MLRSVTLDGRQVDALILTERLSPAVRRLLAGHADRPVVVIPDDGEVVPALATIGRAYIL